MQKTKLSNIIIEDCQRLHESPALYCITSASLPKPLTSGSFELVDKGIYDFTTYLNSISIKKWQRYTATRHCSLHLEIQGSSCVISLTRGLAGAEEAELLNGQRVEVEASDSWVTLDISYPTGNDAVIYGFIVETNGAVRFRNCHYFTELESSETRNIELALVFTTFKKEAFIQSNISEIQQGLFESEEPLASHITTHVVDNGRTLSGAIKEPLHQKILIHPNINAGGAGGFARGMIEALEQDTPATHVVLMDDDVELSFESIKRLFYLLQILSPEHQKSFISGAMLHIGAYAEQWEDVGQVVPQGFFKSVKPQMNMSLLKNVILNETLEVNSPSSYAGWWLCCIPAEIIKENGLPLPLFIRGDDVEYSLRCQAEFITMNGICIWHQPFNSRYSAVIERYQTIRNIMVIDATLKRDISVDWFFPFKSAVDIELRNLNYHSVELALEGFEDFLKGPDFLRNTDGGQLFAQKNQQAEQLEVLSEEDWTALSISYNSLYSNPPINPFFWLIDKLTFSGNRLPKRCLKDTPSIIPFEGWWNYRSKARNRKTLLAVDIYNHKSKERSRDKERFQALWKRYKEDAALYKKTKEQLSADYSATHKEFTTTDFWRKFLKLV